MRSVTARCSNLCRDNLPGHFKVKEYCPLVFRDLRRRFLIDDIEYKVLIIGSYLFLAEVVVLKLQTTSLIIVD